MKTIGFRDTIVEDNKDLKCQVLWFCIVSRFNRFNEKNSNPQKRIDKIKNYLPDSSVTGVV